jgi:hypothetical protein
MVYVKYLIHTGFIGNKFSTNSKISDLNVSRGANENSNNTYENRNVGYDFPADQVRNIQIGKTSKEEIRNTFGEPWRVGLENGHETWTYGKYNYKGFRETDAMDLVVRFTEEDIVESYTFSATNR